MSHQLTFAQLMNYDPGQPGITVDTSLSLNSDRVTCEAKIDTGSTFCLFSRKIGEDLGLQVESGLRRLVSAVTGTFVVYLHEVNLSIAGYTFSVLAGFAEDEAFQRNVLGRRGFMEQVRLGLIDYVGLIDYEGKFYLSCYDE